MLNLKKYLKAAAHQPYPKVLFIAPFLILIVYFPCIFETQPATTLGARSWGFYHDSLFNIVAAILLTHWVRRQSIKLDQQLPWHLHFAKRLQQQFLHGFLFPVMMAITWASAYAIWLEINMMGADYFRRYLPFMVLMLLFINVLAFAWNQYFRRSPYVHRKTAVVQLQVEKHLAANEIACVYVADGICYYRTNKGESFIWTGTLEEAETQLGAAFFLIRRGVLINRDAIVTVLPEDKLLKVVLAFEVPVSLAVSHRRLAKFKKWTHQ